MKPKRPAPSATAREIGTYYERITEEKLKKEGMRLLCRSYVSHPHEIDLIMLDGKDIVFVEVKARLKDDPVAPEFHADTEKMKNLFSAARSFIAEQSEKGVDMNAFSYRFDLAAVEHDREHRVTDFRYYRNFYEAQFEG